MHRNRVPEPLAARVQIRVPARGAARAALARVRARRRRASPRDAACNDTWGGILNDAVLVFTREMSAALTRIRERGAACPARDAAHHSAHRHMPLLPLPGVYIYWNE